MNITFTDWLKFKPSERKLRLFSCACARWLWHGTPCTHCDGGKKQFPTIHTPCALCHGEKRISRLPDPRSRHAVEVAERFADGLATEEECRGAFLQSRLQHIEAGQWFGEDIAVIAASLSGVPKDSLSLWLTNTPACPQAAMVECLGGQWVKCGYCTDGNTQGVYSVGYSECSTCHGAGVVLGKVTLCGKEHPPMQSVNPWPDRDYFCAACDAILVWGGIQQPCARCGGEKYCTGDDGSWVECPACSGSCGTTTVGTVQRLAQRIYDERRWEDMPILADALADSGCENQVVLEHCRGAGPHARGCWDVDLILWKG